MVDIVHFASAIAQIDEHLDYSKDVFVGQHHGTGGFSTAHFGVEFHPANAGQVIGVRVVEQALEQRLHGIFRRWLTGAHHAVDRHACGKLIHGLIGAQSL